MSPPISPHSPSIPSPRITPSPASRKTFNSGASRQTFVGSLASRQRVVHGNVIYPSFTPAVPPIEEEVEDPAVQLTYSDGNTFGVADAEGQVYVKPIHAKRVAVHFCGRGKCCTRVAGERWIVADRIDHLPICHAWCWERERDRLKQMEVERNGLPLCHRRCYNEAVSQLDDPGATEEVVPHMRVLHERLREKTLACHFQDHQNERRIAKRRAETWFEAS